MTWIVVCAVRYGSPLRPQLSSGPAMLYKIQKENAATAPDEKMVPI